MIFSAYKKWTQSSIAGFQDGKRRYKKFINLLGADGARVLHFGCGRDLNETHKVFSEAEWLMGVDVDQQALKDYPGLSWWLEGQRLPFSDNTFDYVVSEYVLEHLDDPTSVFREIFRVLVPGGRFISVAPNKWSYKSLAAMLVPNKLHARFVSILRPDSGREDEDVYPTRFRANSAGDLRRLADASGGKLVSIEYCNNGPTWFRRMPGLFELGLMFHKLLDWGSLRGLRCNLLVEMVKPGEGARSDAVFACPDCGGSMEGEPGKNNLQCNSCSSVFELSSHNVYCRVAVADSVMADKQGR